MTGQATSLRVDSALANLHDIIDGQIESVAALESWLSDRWASDKTYQDISSSINPLLTSNKDKLLEARRTHLWPFPPGCSIWGTITWARISSNTLTVTHQGHELHGGFEVPASSSVEMSLKVLANALDALTATDSQIARLAQLIADMEASSTSGSPAKTVHNHIRLLGQYNDAKDIAQQLIGLIADNRGVPAGSLYQADQYGVGPDD